MKLATYKDGSRDGQLVVVARDLSTAHYATGIASTLQQVLDDWNFLAPQLQDLSVAVNQGRARHAFAFDPRRCMAPLPRVYGWDEALAFPNHLALAWPGLAAGQLHWLPAAGGEMAGPFDDVCLSKDGWAADFGAGLAVVTGDVPAGVASAQALDGVRLLMLVNSWTLHACPATAGGVARLATACSSVAVTPDELGDAWTGGRVHQTLQASVNGRKVGMNEGADMGLHFGQLLAQRCQVRGLRAGAVVGSGPVSSPAVESASGPAWPRGYSCIAEKRGMDERLGSQPLTPYLQYGDAVRLDMKGRDGNSVFGAIEQTLVPLD